MLKERLRFSQQHGHCKKVIPCLYEGFMSAWLICFECVNLSRLDVHSWALGYAGHAVNRPLYCIFTVVEKSLNLWEGERRGEGLLWGTGSWKAVCLMHMCSPNAEPNYPVPMPALHWHFEEETDMGWRNTLGWHERQESRTTGRAAEVRQIKDAFLRDHIPIHTANSLYCVCMYVWKRYSESERSAVRV